MNINLHIERLVLDGLNITPGNSHLLRSAVESELTRLLAAGGLSSALVSGSAMPHITGTGIQLNANDSLSDLGSKIAGSVYGGIGE